MKYMGSKRKLLAGALSEVLEIELQGKKRFVDLFSGSGAVSHYVSSKYSIPVVAVDLQKFATILADSFLSRTQKIDGEALAEQWCHLARRAYNKSALRFTVEEWEMAKGKKLRKCDVMAARAICRKAVGDGPSWNAYGGYYLSPLQVLHVDSLLKTLPEDNRSECLAALIVEVGKAVASPGHTAQPFQPTKKGLPYIQEAWGKNIIEQVCVGLKQIGNIYSKVAGCTFCGDSQAYVDTYLEDGDLVFIDPPYSAVQYSRFYHVLETIARRVKPNVEGKGRYPDIEQRPQSKFSNSGTSKEAMRQLLQALSKKDVSAIVTFPEGECSNGLSSAWIKEEAGKYFAVYVIKVNNNFSTLGGNNDNRGARKKMTEVILILHKKEKPSIATHASVALQKPSNRDTMSAVGEDQ